MRCETESIDNIYRNWDKSYEELSKFLFAVQDKNLNTHVVYQNRHTNHAGTDFFTVFSGRLVFAL